MTNKDLHFKLKLADQNLAASILHRNNNSLHGVSKETQGCILFNIGTDCMDGHLNGALCLDHADPDWVFNEAKNFFSKDDRGFVFWVRDHADRALESYLQAKGYNPVRIPGSTGMMIETPIDMSQIPELPKDIAIQKVAGAKDVEAYAAVIRDAFDKSEDVTGEMFSHVEILTGETAGAWVAYRDHRPIAAATMVLSGKAAGIYYVGTVSDERGKGLGAMITAVATNAGFRLGAEAVVLQASLAGEKVYAKLGYEAITHYRWYLIPADSV